MSIVHLWVRQTTLFLDILHAIFSIFSILLIQKDLSKFFLQLTDNNKQMSRSNQKKKKHAPWST